MQPTTLTMPTSGLGSTAETNRLLGGSYFNEQTGAQIKPFVPSNTQTTISTDVLGTQPLKLPTVQNTTTASGLNGLAAGVFESEKILQDQQAKVKETTAQLNERTKGIESNMNQILELQAGRAQAEEDAGITQMTQDVNKANKAYLSSQRAEVNEQRALESQVGLSPEGKQQASAAISRKYAFENADNALTLSLARQDLATAENILNKKYELQMEPLKTVLDYQKFFYQENKADMTKAEDREFQVLLAQNTRDYNLKLADYNSIGELALMAGKNGAPASLVTQISNAPTKAEAMRLASGYAADPLDRQLKQQQLAESIAKTQAALTALPGPVQTKVQGIASQFDAEQVVKNFNQIAQAKAFVDSVPNDTTNPSDDQGLIYAFAKIMDPDSVVREGEYNTVQKYSQSWVKAYGRSVNQAINGTGFLSKEARENIKKTIDSKYSVAEKTYKNVYDEYGRRINKVTGKTDGTDYITDYAQAFETPGSTPTVDVRQATISGRTVTFPGGGSLTFPDDKSLNLFKKEQGL